jgi:carboxylesterase
MPNMTQTSSVPPHAAPFSAPARPEETDGRRIGVLVSHGFTGSPVSIRPWAEAFAAQGYAVEAPLLPGHATSSRDLNTKRWSDWYSEIRRAHAKLAAENDVVLAAGLSLGGALVLRLAADLGNDLAGVMVVNAAVRTERKDVLALPLLKWLVPALPGIGNDIALPGVDEFGYADTPLKATHSMMQGWRALREDLPRITAPVLFFKSTFDHVVDPSSLAVVRERVSGPFEVVDLPDSFHVATLDHDAALIESRSIEFVRQVAAPV